MTQHFFCFCFCSFFSGGGGGKKWVISHEELRGVPDTGTLPQRSTYCREPKEGTWNICLLTSATVSRRS